MMHKPLIIFRPMNYPLRIPLSWWLALRGYNLYNLWTWLEGYEQATTEEWQCWQHFEVMKQKKECHYWHGKEYHYCGS